MCFLRSAGNAFLGGAVLEGEAKQGRRRVSDTGSLAPTRPGDIENPRPSGSQPLTDPGSALLKRGVGEIDRELGSAKPRRDPFRECRAAR